MDICFIGGTTFHAGLRFSFRNEMAGIKDEQMQQLRQQFEEMMVVIIDEMSLVGADFFYNVHRRLVDILQMEDMFADRGVMLVGDLLQIPPVMATPIFLKPLTQQNKSLWNTDANLWNSCSAVNLKTNFRVGDSPWNECLNRIRLGEENE